MASYNTIECEVTGRIAAVTLNRPNKLNAISFEMQNELVAALEEVAADPNIHVAIIQGAGKAFSAGFDITVGSTAGGGGGGGVPKDRANIEKLMLNWLRIWDLPIPVIGKVRGYCLAGGAQLAAICDITFAANEAKIGTPKLPLGAGFAGTIWTWFVGPKKLKKCFSPQVKSSPVPKPQNGACLIVPCQMQNSMKRYPPMLPRLRKPPKIYLSCTKNPLTECRRFRVLGKHCYKV